MATELVVIGIVRGACCGRRTGGKKSLVSVVIPMYNAQGTIRRCLESVMGQTHRDIEIIVIDDGSQDEGAGIVSEMAQTDCRIRYIYQANGGVSTARNHGIDAATGEYLCFVDSDDAIEKEYVSLLYNKISSTSSDVALCGFCEIDENSDIKRILSDDDFSKLRGKLETDFYILRHFTGSPCMKMYSTKIIRDHGLRFREDMVTAEDQYFNYVYYGYCSTISYVNYAGYIYYTHESGLSHKRTQQCLNNEIENIRYGLDFMKKYKIENGLLMIGSSICYAVSRYIFLTDAENTYVQCRTRLQKMNLLHQRICMPRWQDKIIFNLMYYRQYGILYILWKMKKGKNG